MTDRMNSINTAAAARTAGAHLEKNPPGAETGGVGKKSSLNALDSKPVQARTVTSKNPADAIAFQMEEGQGQLEALMQEFIQKRTQAIGVLQPLDAAGFQVLRNPLAKQLGLSVSAIDEIWKELRKESREEKKYPFKIDIEPADEEVQIEKLVNRIRSLFKRFIVFPEPADYYATAAALWCLATWFVDYLEFTPYAMITAPERNCGKSQLLNLMAKLSRRPLQAGNVTGAAAFRVIEEYCPTFFIDETDTFLENVPDLQGILNIGINRDGGKILRCAKDPSTQTQELVQFSTFCFKAFSGINAHKTSDALRSRAIEFKLQRKGDAQKVENPRYEPAETWEKLQRQCARAVQQYGERVRSLRPDIPEKLSNREADKWETLFKISELSDDREFKDYIRQVALKLSELQSKESLSAGEELLYDIREVFSKLPQWEQTYILTSLLLDKLNNEEEGYRWHNFCRGSKPLHPKKLADMLSGYGIKAHQLGAQGYQPYDSCDKGKKAYFRADFIEPWNRYLNGQDFPEA